MCRVWRRLGRNRCFWRVIRVLAFRRTYFVSLMFLRFTYRDILNLPRRCVVSGRAHVVIVAGRHVRPSCFLALALAG